MAGRFGSPSRTPRTARRCTSSAPSQPALLDIRGGTVTADAMNAQRATTGTVTGKGGNRVLAPRGSQERLHDDVRLRMADPENAGKMLCFNDVDRGHGRIEIREATVCHDVDTLQDLHRSIGFWT